MFSCYFIVFQEKTSVREGVPSQTLKGGRMKKSYPGIQAKLIKGNDTPPKDGRQRDAQTTASRQIIYTSNTWKHAIHNS